MQINSYKETFNRYFSQPSFEQQTFEAKELINRSKRIFFIGNGGSNSICSHMMEDYAKIGGFPTFSFSDAALITCFANDYGYDFAMKEWLKIHFSKDDLLVAISSSGQSKNILEAAAYARELNGGLITLTGFKESNPLRSMGKINFYIDSSSYGVVECLHQIILHAILDEIQSEKINNTLLSSTIQLEEPVKPLTKKAPIYKSKTTVK